MAVLAPYVTLLAVSVSRSWGLEFWQNLTLAHYRFILFEYDGPGAIVNNLVWPPRRPSPSSSERLSRGGDLRTRLPGMRVLDYASLVPLGLPGIVVAVALIQFWLRVPFPSTARLLIILLAYTGRYVPLAVRSANAAFRQIDPSLEETARVTSAGWLDVREHHPPLPGRTLRGLAPRVRAGHPGAERLDPALQLRLDHAGGGGLQPLRDRLSRAGGRARDRHHGHHRVRHLAGDRVGRGGARVERAGVAH